MRFFGLLVVFHILIGQLRAEDVTALPPVHNMVDLVFPQSYQESSNTIYVPFRLVGRLIMVEAQVDTVVGNFFFDTGAERLILNEKYFVSDYALPDVGSIGTTGLIEETKVRQIDSLEWDNIVFRQQNAHVVNLNHLEAKKKIRLIGILGYEVFKDFEIFLDYQLGRIVLTRLNKQGYRIDPDVIRMAPYDSLSFRHEGHAILVNVEVEGVKMVFALDSGAELNLLDRRIRKKVLKKFEVLKRVKMVGVGNKEVEMLAGVLRDVQIGELRSVGMRTLLTNMADINRAFGITLNGVLGYEFLFNKRTLINYKRKKLYFFKPQMS